MTPSAALPSPGLDLLDSLARRFPGVLYRCSADEHWTMSYLSPGIEALSGFPAEAFVGNRERSYASLIHPEDRDKVDREVDAAVSKGQPFDIEYRIVDAGGRVRWVQERGHAVLDEVGRAQFLDGVILETTRTRRLAEQLSAIIEHTPNVAIQSYSEDGVVLSWNPAAERLFGWRADEAIGRRLDEFLLSPEDFAGFVDGLKAIAERGGASSPSEWTCDRPDGGKAHCLATQFEIPAVDGQGRVFICMDVDVGELHAAREALSRSNEELESRVADRSLALKQAMEQLMEAERLAALGRIVAGVAHELNTPIGNARTTASTLKDWIAAFRERLGDTTPLRRSELDRFVADSLEAAALMERAAERAAEQITHFKQVAVDQHGGQRRQFTLDAMLRDVAPSLQLAFRTTPHRFVMAPAANVAMDSFPGPLEQVLAILVQNALRHGLEERPQGGEVRLATRLGADGCVEITVEDDGVGIPEAIRPKVFDPFFTTRLGRGGSGLGLHIAHNLTTGLLGGTLELAPPDPHQPGCRFVLRLPRVAPAQASE
jgi:PAS domain S-box-containing protein